MADMPIVCIADALPEDVVARIEELGCRVARHPDAEADQLPAVLRDCGAQVVVVRSTRVNAEVFAAAPSLELVIRAGAGVNTIDLDAASAHAVRVANCPGTNAAAVAELTLGLILSLDRFIPDNVELFRRGQWAKKRFGAARGLSGTTLGVVGTGSIGCAVIDRAKAFGMTVVAWSRSLTEERAENLGVRCMSSLVELAENSDVVSVHLAAAPETRGILDAAFFGALRHGAHFVNTSRADVVDHDALHSAVEERGVRAALDVFPGEPSGGAGEVDVPWKGHPGYYVTHHIGASTAQAQEAVAAATVERVAAFLGGREVPSVVNMGEGGGAATGTGSGTAVIEIRHRNRIGVLAHALTELERAGINVRSMRNDLFSGEEGAVATITVEPAPDEATMAAVTTSHGDILAVRAVAADPTAATT